MWSISKAVSPQLTWCDGNAVAVDNRAFLLLLLGRLDALLLHVADRFVPLPLPLSTGSGSRQQLVSHIKEHGRGLGRGLGRAIEVICKTKTQRPGGSRGCGYFVLLQCHLVA